MDKTFYDEIILKFSLNNCKKNNDYLIEFSLEDNSNQFETEKIKSKSEKSLLEFSKNATCKYYFYKIQNVQLRIKRLKDRIHYKYLLLEDKNHLSLSTIIKSNNFTYEVQINGEDEDSEKLIIQAEKVNKLNNINSLVDYLSAGVGFESYIGIDFSDKKFHFVDISKNQYINAIGGFRETLFDFQRNFEVYGFGANLLKNKDSSFFNLSLTENPNLLGLTSIKEAYTEYLKKNDLNENNNNNYLSPLLNHIQKRIYEKKNLTNYNILFLLINKCPKKDDIQNTIDTLIHSSFLPLSIVIIGIGDNENEFKNIKNLYMNNNKSSKGIAKLMNNIFFISMKECNYDDSILKNKCLKEIPKQMTTFYELAKISINQISEKNLINIEQCLQNLKNKYKNNDPAPPLLHYITEEKGNYIFKSDVEKENNNNSYKDNKDNKDNNKNNNIFDNNENNNNGDKKNINDNNKSVKKRKSSPENNLNNLNNKITNNNLNIINNTNSDNSIPRPKIDNGKKQIIKILNPICEIKRSSSRKKTQDNKQISLVYLKNLANKNNKEIKNNNNNFTKSNEKNDEGKNINKAHKKLKSIPKGTPSNYNIYNQFLNNNNLFENKTKKKKNIKISTLSIEYNPYYVNKKNNILKNTKKEEKNNNFIPLNEQNNNTNNNNYNIIENTNIQKESINPIKTVQQSVSSPSFNLNNSQQSEVFFASKVNMINN